MSRESAILETQHAILDIISGNSHLMTTHGSSVYDYVPESITANGAPYIQIGDPTEIPWDTLGCGGTPTGYGQRITYTLHVWSTYRGKKEAADIITHLKELLDDTNLTITGYTHVWARSEFSTIMRDPDMLHYHGVLRLGVYVTQE